jgi:GDP-4-dehydro-6-deoxy-D-mannose reductase
MRILITGVTGFAGSHLAEFILANFPDSEIIGTIRWRSPMENIRHLESKVNLIETDLRDASSTKSLIASNKPNVIFHLAAQSFVPTSWSAPAETLTTNILSTLYILEAARSLSEPPRILVACSSEEYGAVRPEDLPIAEDCPLRPLSPYAVSKVGQDMLSFQYYQSYKIPVIRTRAFNHTGPRRGKVFVSSNFAMQVVELEKGKRQDISVGNLEAIRDFSDVRDIMRGYWLAVEKGEPGEVYNLASGVGVTIKDLLHLIISKSKLDPKKVKITPNPERMRPSDVPVLIGNSDKFRSVTGWKNEIPLERTIEDLVQYWRERV